METSPHRLKSELYYLGALFLIFLVLLKIIFYKEGFLLIFRIVLTIFYLFIMPGYFLMSIWDDELDFLERIVIGFGIGAAIIGVFGYLLRLIGVNIMYSMIFLPIITSVISVYLRRNAIKKSN